MNQGERGQEGNEPRGQPPLEQKVDRRDYEERQDEAAGAQQRCGSRFQVDLGSGGERSPKNQRRARQASVHCGTVQARAFFLDPPDQEDRRHAYEERRDEHGGVVDRPEAKQFIATEAKRRVDPDQIEGDAETERAAGRTPQPKEVSQLSRHRRHRRFGVSIVLASRCLPRRGFFTG